MKVGVIGAGRWGMNLVRSLRSLGALSAVAEPCASRRMALADEYADLPLYEDHRALLRSEVSAVAIATPVACHFEIAREALLANKDVFIEKPMVFTSHEAEELLELSRSRHRVLMVGHLLLYQPAVLWMKSFLEAGKLGAVHSLHGERLNLGRARRVENALWSLGVHDVAVLLHLVGTEPERIQVTGQAVLSDEVEDDIHLHLEFPSGIHAHLHCSWLMPTRRRRLVVVGSKGMLEHDEENQLVILHHKGIRGDLEAWDRGSEVLFRGSEEPLRLEMEHFLERLEDRRPPLSDGVSGLRVVRVLEAATRLLRPT